MKRFALAAGLVAAAASTSEAGYLVVRVLLEGSGGGAGSTVAAGPSGPGGFGGMSPFGPGGMPSGRPGMPGPAGGGGLSGGGPAAGGGMKPGGGGLLGSAMGGYGGMPGYGPPGAVGQAVAGPPADPTKSIFVVVPFTKPPQRRAFYPRFGEPNQFFNPEWRLGFAHPYGYTNLFVDNAAVQAYADFGQATPPANKTRQSQVAEKHDAWVKKNGTDGQILLDLVTEALAYGMVAEAVQYADELAAAAADKKLRTPPPVVAFLDAYAKVQRPLRDLPAQRGDGAAWVKRFLDGGFLGAQSVTRGHYDLVYWDASEEDRARRLGQLEDNLRAFYLWHATQGRALPVPDRPLTAILPKTAADTIKLANSLDRFPVVADSFYVPEFDALVLAPERLDEVGQTFQRQLQQMYTKGASRQALLDGNGRKIAVPIDTTRRTKDSKLPEEVALMMTYAMVERYAADATEWQAVSREGSRQLGYAAGLLPRHVTLPLWLGSGAASFYQRPRGPVFTTKEDGEKEKTVATVGLTTGYGVPNFVYQKLFREMVEKKQLNPDPGRTLQNVVSDGYFVALADRLDADDPRLPLPPVVKKKDPPAGVGIGSRPGDFLTRTGSATPDPVTLERKRLTFLRDKAYATSWALYYYLAKKHPGQLARYTAELARMPRDLPIDEPTRLRLFAEAFDLTTGPAREGDRETFKEFAARWLKAMDSLPPAGVDIELTEPTPATAGTAASLPNFPGFPPGGGGGSGDGNP
ncbi:MAG: hypothetical protein K2X87_23235 [Gemmataceae bacterium]|nr:hypothetical protein [Gemmataceae bacterium]